VQISPTAEFSATLPKLKKALTYIFAPQKSLFKFYTVSMLLLVFISNILVALQVQRF